MDYQNIFNRDFYPTPAHVIDQMCAGEDVSGKIILEPSAGKGDIVRWLYRMGAKNVLACEINDTLRRSLRDCDVIGTDFLQLTAPEVAAIDMIVMNPPFMRGLDHLQHAYDIAPDGCTIICVLPSSRFTSRHLCSPEIRSGKYQKLGETIDLYGSHHCIGAVFSEAERTHDYDIELVKIYKPKQGDSEFDDYLFSMDETDTMSSGQKAGLMPYNEVYNLVSRYIDAVKQFDAVDKMNKHINEATSTFSDFNIRFGATGRDGEGHDIGSISRDRYKKELQKAAWKKVINIFHMEKYATSKLKEQLNRFVEAQCHIPFTMRNIYTMVDVIMQTNNERMEASICDAFDLICSFAPENISINGKKANNTNEWKTNSNYMVNRKFIVPGIADIGSYSPHRYVDIHYDWYHNVSNMEDIMKALSFISGKNLMDVAKEYLTDSQRENLYNYATFRNIMRCAQLEWGEWHEFGWFRVKFFKKGTMHFEFIGEEGEQIWYRFNQTAARHKGWAIGTQSQTKKKRK